MAVTALAASRPNVRMIGAKSNGNRAMNTTESSPNRPAVSVVIPAFNAAQTLERAVKSVVNSNVNAQIVVVNDGSADDTLETAYELQKTYPIDVLTQENTGLGGARETGGKHIVSEYITFLDADDECHPNRLRAQMDALSSITVPAIMFCGTLQVFPDLSKREKCCRFSDEVCEEITERFLNARILPSGASIIMRTSHYRDLGGFKSEFRRQCEEDFFSRAVAHGTRFYCVPQALYIQHLTSRSNSNQTSGRVDALKKLILLWEKLDDQVKDEVMKSRLRRFIKKRLLLHAAKSIYREKPVRKKIIKIAVNTSWPSRMERLMLHSVAVTSGTLSRFVFEKVRKIRWLTR